MCFILPVLPSTPFCFSKPIIYPIQFGALRAFLSDNNAGGKIYVLRLVAFLCGRTVSQ
jgi:hypothetical protein